LRREGGSKERRAVRRRFVIVLMGMLFVNEQRDAVNGQRLGDTLLPQRPSFFFADKFNLVPPELNLPLMFGGK